MAPPYGGSNQFSQHMDLARSTPLEIYKTAAERGSPRSIRAGMDAFLKEHPEQVALVEKASAAIDAKLTGGVSFTRTEGDPFAEFEISVRDYFVERNPGTNLFVFELERLFADLDRERGPGQAAMFRG